MNENIKSAIDDPRPHHQLVPMKIFYEIGAKKVECILKMCNCMLICIKLKEYRTSARMGIATESI